MKINILSTNRCSQKLGELEKNGNCSSPVGGEGGAARRSVASYPHQQEQQHNTAQRNVRGLSVRLFVNEDDETGQFILGLCFPMAPPATERAPLEPKKSRGTRLDEGARVAASWARLVTAGPASWIPRHATTTTLCCFSNFMKKEGRSGTAGEGIAGGHCSPDTWRLTSWGGAMRAGGAGWRERKWNDVVEGEVEWREWIRQSEAK